MTEIDKNDFALLQKSKKNLSATNLSHANLDGIDFSFGNFISTNFQEASLNNVDFTPVARVVNFACHGVCDGGQYLEWSGDFSGEMSAFIEAAEMPAVALFIQGAGGNVHPFDWWFGQGL